MRFHTSEPDKKKIKNNHHHPASQHSFIIPAPGFLPFGMLKSGHNGTKMAALGTFEEANSVGYWILFSPLLHCSSSLC